MNKNNESKYLSIMVSLISIISVALLFLHDRDIEYLYLVLLCVIMLVIIATFLIVFVPKIRREMSDEHLYDKNLVKLNKVIQYNQKRKEIEQEIEKLTRELIKSDVSQYVDIHRLAFSGQNANLGYDTINYDNFLKQFGIEGGAIKVKENSAVFLTPFNADGEDLFVVCQTILGRVNIFLQKTDNFVEKDDILMNIVSMIVQSELVIVNIDGRNPNVYYELGIAHAIGKPTILLSKAGHSSDDIGFDVRQKKIIMYKDWMDLEMQLLYQINRLKEFFQNEDS